MNLVLFGLLIFAVSAGVVGWLAWRTGSVAWTAGAAIALALIVVPVAALAFGRYLSANEVDAVVGLVWYVIAPCIALGAGVGGAIGLWLGASKEGRSARPSLLLGAASILLAGVSLGLSLTLMSVGYSWH